MPTIASRRLHRAALAVLAALALSLIIAVLIGDGSSTVGGRLGGDFPEFYGAGTIVVEGDAAQLYDVERQALSQEGLFAGDDTGYLDFAYPPAVAAVYAPLSLLPYRLAYLVHVGWMVAALVLGLRMVRPMVEAVRGHFVVVLAGATAFFPMFRGITGGQNTALTLLCLVGAWRARHDDRDLVAGLWLGAMLFKPQLAALALIAQLVSRRWRVIAGAGISALALWATSALTMGPGWLGPFLRHGLSVPSGDGRVGGGGSVSLIGTAHRFDGSIGDVLLPVAVACSLAAAAVCLLAWRRLDGSGRDQIGLGFAVLAAGTVLASPHVIFYDAGILVMVGLYGIQAAAPRVVPHIAVMVAASWLGGFDSLPVNALFLISVAALMWVLSRVAALSAAGVVTGAPTVRPGVPPIDGTAAGWVRSRERTVAE